METKVALEVILKKWVRISYIKLLTLKTKRGWIQDSILEANQLPAYVLKERKRKIQDNSWFSVLSRSERMVRRGVTDLCHSL